MAHVIRWNRRFWVFFGASRRQSSNCGCTAIVKRIDGTRMRLLLLLLLQRIQIWTIADLHAGQSIYQKQQVLSDRNWAQIVQCRQIIRRIQWWHRWCFVVCCFIYDRHLNVRFRILYVRNKLAKNTKLIWIPCRKQRIFHRFPIRFEPKRQGKHSIYNYEWCTHPNRSNGWFIIGRRIKIRKCRWTGGECWCRCRRWTVSIDQRIK